MVQSINKLTMKQAKNVSLYFRMSSVVKGCYGSKRLALEDGRVVDVSEDSTASRSKAAVVTDHAARPEKDGAVGRMGRFDPTKEEEEEDREKVMQIVPQ